jgi:glycosyltransferase involved in cell wall biosynthesis
MRILHVVQPPVGGTPVVVDLLARAQAARHEVGVAGRPAMARRLEGAPVRVWALPMERNIQPRADAAYLRALVAIVRGFRPDVIHAHSSKAGVLGRVAGALTRTPVVFSPHNFAHRIHEGGLPKRAAFFAIELALAPLTAHLHTSHAAEARHALRTGLGRRGRVSVIPNGIDAAPLLALAPPPARPEPVVGTYARLWPQKRVDLLLRAAAILRDDGFTLPVRVIGDGPLREELGALARDLGLDAEFVPDPGGPAQALALLDLYVLSSDQEAQPLVPIEAMAAGRPVVATAVGGVADVVQDGVTGLLVAPGGAAALARAIGRVVSDGDLRARLAAAGRDAAAGFDAAAMAQAMDAVYERVVSARPRRSRAPRRS